MIARGERAPDFEGRSSSGETLSLSSLRGRPLILYFFPKSGTPGCTRESLEFATLHRDFEQRGIGIVGVSVDSTEDLREFQEHCKLPFPLISDHERTIAREYGVLGALGYAKRVTFYIDPEGRVSDVIEGFLPGPHVRWARGLLHDRSPPKPP